MKELDTFRKFLSENTTMPDFTIMGQKFNFSDICPSAHKLVQNQAIVHHGFSNTAPIVLYFAIKHREFFNLERKALGSQGITVDEYNDDVTRLYTEILNIAEKLGVRKKAKEYMDMHMGKIKDAGFKASEPGGSSDMNFEEAIEEVRNRLGDVVEGYTDLHKNDVVLESFLGEEELNEDNTQSTFDDYFAPVVGNNKTMPDMNTQQALEDKAIDVNALSPDYLADFYNFPEYKETLDPKMINPQEFRKAIGRLGRTSYKNITGEETLGNVLPYPNYYTFVKFGDDAYLAHEYGKYHTKLNFGAYLEESNAERNPIRGIKNMFQAVIPLKLDTTTLGSLGYAKATGIEGDWNAIQFFTEYPDKYEKYGDLLKQANRFGVDVNLSTNVLKAYNAIAAAANEYELREELDERQKYADDQLKFKEGDTVYFNNIKGAAKYPMTITGPGKFRKTNRMGAGGKEIIFPVKGGPGGKGMYAADVLTKNIEDIPKGSFEDELSPSVRSGALKATPLEEKDTPWKVTVTDEKTGEKSSFLYKDENDAIKYARTVNDEHDGYSAVVNVVKEDQKKIDEGPVKTFTSGLDKYQSYPHVYVFKVRTMSTDKQGDKFVYNNTYEVKDGLDWNGVLAQVDQLIASPETIGVGVDIYYTTGQKEGKLGGQAEVVRWSHDAVYKAPKSDYILNARKNQFEDEEAERIIAIRKFMNSSLMGAAPQNVDNQAEKLYPAIKRMKDEVKSILATK
jgi:hypothetical protein